jgi:hypothetical protein
MELIKPQKGTNYNIEHDIQNLTTIEQGFEQIDNKITNDITSSIDELKDKVDNDITTAITELDNKVDTEIVTAIDNLETKVNTEISESITALDNKVTTSLQEQAESLKKEISDQIAKVIANSPEDFDTLKEISDWISGHSSDATSMNSAISGNTSAINQEILDRQAADTALQTNIDKKVDKVSGKGLSTNDYTTDEKNKLAGIANGANKTIVDSTLSSTSTNPVQNKVVNAALGNKVDKENGKGLSTNDFTDAEKTKLDGIEKGANKTIVDSSLSSTSTNPVQNKIIYSALSSKANISDLDNKVDKNSRITIPATTDLNLSSFGEEPLSIGTKTGENIGIDTNEIQARKNGAASELYINTDGGKTYIGKTNDSYSGLVVRGRLTIPTSAPSSPQAGDIWIG